MCFHCIRILQTAISLVQNHESGVLNKLSDEKKVTFNIIFYNNAEI